MIEQEYTQRLFGTVDDGVLYLPGSLMKAANLKPGDKIKITSDDSGLKIARIGGPRPGGPTE